MNNTILAAVVALFTLSTVACAAPVATSSNGSSLAGDSANENGGAGCSDACAYYYECKGDTTTDQSQCVSLCEQKQFSQSQIDQYMGLDCPTAVKVIDGPNDPPAPSSSSGGSTGSQCNGCAWDGSQCIWLSQSDWGPGAYSGAASSCDASCCPGH